MKTGTDQVKESGHQMGIGDASWLTAVQHETESEHSGLDDVRVDQLLLPDAYDFSARVRSDVMRPLTSGV